jgi:streptomycin 6-kinase
LALDYAWAMSLDAFQPWFGRWQLTADGEPFETKYKSRLLPVRFEGMAAILKISAGEEERKGAHLMAWYAGEGAARVLAHEAEAILLERAPCRRNLAEMAKAGEDDDASRIICAVAANLHLPRVRPPPRTLVPLPIWFRALAPAAAEHGGVYVKSLASARALLKEPRDIVVLHGDLHHDNILDGGERGWLAIDPKGLIGERDFEFANLFRNPSAELALEPGRMQRQLAIVSEEAGLDPTRLLQWILAYAGLGAAWSIQSGHDPKAGMAIAELAARELCA